MRPSLRGPTVNLCIHELLSASIRPQLACVVTTRHLGCRLTLTRHDDGSFSASPSSSLTATTSVKAAHRLTLEWLLHYRADGDLTWRQSSSATLMAHIDVPITHMQMSDSVFLSGICAHDEHWICCIVCRILIFLHLFIFAAGSTASLTLAHDVLVCVCECMRLLLCVCESLVLHNSVIVWNILQSLDRLFIEAVQ